uniref:Ig-like domain-containing protein n=1 Tax=Sphenodon punctatus TaxID=8508 RepID=A0A8D0LBG4_SPHPU
MPASPAPQLQDSSSHGLPPHDMVPPLEASSLLLLGGLLHAAAGSSYNISQPPSLSGLVGQSVTLPCSFTFPAEIKPVRAPDIYWRRQSFHGEFIYNHTEGFTHASYRGRISLVGDPQQQSGSIQIRDLKVSDTSTYFCRFTVRWYSNAWKSEYWQSIPGTQLTVQAAGSSYNISQPPSLSGLVGQSVTLPCSFTFPAEIKPIRAPDIYWRRQSFHGEFIYNHTEGFTHASYRGRISLVGDPQQQSGSIQIRDLKVSDTNMYFCCIRVQWYNNGRESECWQSNPGTRLTVQGSRQNGACRSKEPGRPEAEKPTVYEEVREGGFGGPLAASNPPAVPHKQDLVYAALTLSEVDAVSKKPAVQEAPGTETVYSALRV